MIFTHTLVAFCALALFHLWRRPAQYQLKAERDEQQDNNARLKRLHDNLPGIVFQTRSSPQQGESYLYISEGVQNYGITPAAAYADEKAFSSLIHPDDTLRFRIAQSKSRQYLTPFHEEYRIIHGERISWVESRAIPTREADGSTLWDGMMVDITARKEAEAALKVSEEKLKLMAMALANSANGVILCEVVGEKLPIVYLNPAFSDITGYSAEDALNNHMLFLYDSGEISSELESLYDSIAQGRPYSALLKTKHKNGQWFWNNFSLSPIHNRFGDVSHFVGVLNDVTELEDARLTAEKAITIKRDFLANMSHEIRTPLYGILGTVEVMNNSNLPPEQQQWVNILKQTGNSLFALISDILDFSKIEAGTLHLVNAPFSPRTMAEEVSQLLQQSAKDKSLSITLKVDKKIPDQLIGDRDRIQQILNNYLVNAIKFTNKGKIALSLTCEDTSRRKEKQVMRLRFAVSDKGTGIALDKQGAIFDKFTQADTSANRRFGGAGLGLAICKQLAELMNGTVGVESELGKGSTFWLDVPLSIASQQPVTKQVDTPVESLPSFTGKRILLAEDNPINRTVTAAMLQRLKCDVTLAEDGRQALDAFKSKPFDLILMDIQMPVMSGFEATAAIRKTEQLKKAPSTPIIAFTANVLEGLPQECIDCGMDDYLSKPLRLEQLVEKMLSYLASDGSNVIPLRRKVTRPAPKQDTINFAHLDHLRHLLGEQFNDLCTRFVIDTDARLASLRHSSKQQFSRQAAEVAHSIKAAAMNIGAARLYELCEMIEGKATNNEDIATLLETAEQEFKSVREALTSYREQVV